MSEPADDQQRDHPTNGNHENHPAPHSDKANNGTEVAAAQHESEGEQAKPPDRKSKEPQGDNAASGKEGKSLGGWLVLGAAVVLTLFVAALAIARAVWNPRTDDAEVLANFIGMAPQVEGPIAQLPIRDNQLVKAGDLLFVIDERPYQYALERAESDQAALEGQVEDRRRSIRAQISGVRVATANIYGSAFNRDATAATISEANANVVDAKAAVRRDQADLQYSIDNLHRLEPLLAQQFVTADQVEQARTLVETRTRAVQQAEAQVALAEARVRSNESRFDQSDADVGQRRAQRDQAANGVQTLAPLTNQREERSAAVRLAQYNLNNCRVYAPFDGYVTGLTTSLGAYARVGAVVFTMIDARRWWVVANFRETQLKHVVPGSAADLFLLQREGLPLHGTVESIGYGVTPDPSIAGVLTPSLPDVQRTLSWVHLAARYPVRIRVEAPPPNLLRIGQSAVAVVHPTPSERR